MTILISAAFRVVVLIRGKALIQCGYPKVRRLFEAWRLLEEIRYVRSAFSETNTPQFSEMRAFSPKSTRKPPKGHPNLRVFLSRLENEILKFSFENLRHSNTSKEEWEAIRTLVRDRTIVMKKADKGLYVVVWDRTGYVLEAEK